MPTFVVYGEVTARGVLKVEAESEDAAWSIACKAWPLAIETETVYAWEPQKIEREGN